MNRRNVLMPQLAVVSEVNGNQPRSRYPYGLIAILRGFLWEEIEGCS